MADQWSTERYGMVGMRYRMEHDPITGKARPAHVDANTNLNPTEADVAKGQQMLAGRDLDSSQAAWNRDHDWYDQQKATQDVRRETMKGEKASAKKMARLEGWVANGRRGAAPSGLRAPGGVTGGSGIGGGQSSTVALPAVIGKPIAGALQQDKPWTAGGASVQPGIHKKIVTP